MTSTIKAALMLALLVPLTGSALAESIHITGTHDHIRDRNEEAFSKALHTKVIIGTIGNRRYTLEEVAMFAYHFEVGTDYPILKVSDKNVDIQVTDKKGRESKEVLRVVSVEEVE